MSSNFVIMGRDRTGFAQVLDAAYNKREAEEMVAEYREACGSDWSVWYQQRQRQDGEI